MHVKKVSVLCIVTCFLGFQKIHNNQVISFFFRSYYETYPTEPKKLVERIKKPGKIEMHSLEHSTEYTLKAGIAVSYAGYLDISDANGQISFPRKHTAPFVYLLITPELMPVLSFNNTVDHWTLIAGQPADLFKIERIADEKNTYQWHITTMPLPTDMIIPLETITIFTDPKRIVVPMETVETDGTENLELPDLYVKKGPHVVHDSLYLLTISHLIRPIRQLYKTEPVFYEYQVRP